MLNINNLIKIADFLDKEGKGSDADLIDYFIKKFSVDGGSIGPVIAHIPEEERDDYEKVFNPDGSLKRRSSFDVDDDEVEDMKLLSETLRGAQQVSSEYAHNLAKQISEAIDSEIG